MAVSGWHTWTLNAEGQPASSGLRGSHHVRRLRIEAHPAPEAYFASGAHFTFGAGAGAHFTFAAHLAACEAHLTACAAHFAADTAHFAAADAAHCAAADAHFTSENSALRMIDNRLTSP
jgi:hypothetical protein